MIDILKNLLLQAWKKEWKFNLFHFKEEKKNYINCWSMTFYQITTWG